ncbi:MULTISPECIES: acyltransferase [unclassified Pseudomonas]|jgi:peptidoglycan/LPS O-acetylase OafA/YrhL|uniref:acyltransferase family protein n=1 Tax=unclassified Pseudomonas TaxID=196821 RepID=UPI000C86B56A|nr:MULTISPECIES: acyltransferase [unclassified Pseudomonas]PMV81806.1 acyltransferase [Pseudomonas sp. GW101-1A09]PMV92646.1 acyltransferase [Pseudomonas sp. GW460-C8]PMV99365.1 acyltransferase [Pseudomonas sp. FW306-2-2C-B10A]PMW03245.1 acyltransferase [Pseudomonas sp. MPR-TSA4]PMW10690.1 acyltransferase [Pseudomonas sp. GW456-11-11-14-TSB2]
MLISVQALRAVAAWTVVCHHFMQIFFDFKARGPVGQMFIDKGAVGVDIFFVISGLVIFLSTEGKSLPPARFLLYRLFRIVPAYWLYTVLMALVVVFAQPVLPDQTVDWSHVLLSLLFIPTQNPGGYGIYPTLNVGWTLNYEMLFYVLFAWALLFRLQVRLLIVAALLFAVCQAWTGYGWISEFYRSDIVYEFLLGIAIGMIYRRGWIKPGVWLPLLGIGGALLAIYNLAPQPRFLAWGVPGAVLVMACMALERFFENTRLFKVLGDCSYSVYLMHVLVLSVGGYVAQRYGVNPYVMFAVCVVTIGVASWASYEYVEKCSYRWLKEWIDGEPASNAVPALSRQKY